MSQKHSGFQALGNIDLNNHEILNPAGFLKALYTPLSDEGLVLYLPFSEAEGELAKDHSKYGNHGKFKGSGEPAWAEGRLGPGVEFDGSDDYVNCGNNSSLDITDAITIEAWVKGNSYGAANLIVARGEGGSTTTQYLLGIWSGVPQFYIGDGASMSYVEHSALSTGVWYHIVGTFDGTTLKIYVNGVKGPTDNTGSLGSLSYAVAIGAYSPGSSSLYPFDGKIDEVRIYNRALSADEILALYLKGFTSGGPGIPKETPASASADGIPGEIAWDDNYIYVCIAANTWKRVAIGTW